MKALSIPNAARLNRWMIRAVQYGAGSRGTIPDIRRHWKQRCRGLVFPVRRTADGYLEIEGE